MFCFSYCFTGMIRKCASDDTLHKAHCDDNFHKLCGRSWCNTRIRNKSTPCCCSHSSNFETRSRVCAAAGCWLCSRRCSCNTPPSVWWRPCSRCAPLPPRRHCDTATNVSRRPLQSNRPRISGVTKLYRALHISERRHCVASGDVPVRRHP